MVLKMLQNGSQTMLKKDSWIKNVIFVYHSCDQNGVTFCIILI